MDAFCSRDRRPYVGVKIRRAQQKTDQTSSVRVRHLAILPVSATTLMAAAPFVPTLEDIEASVTELDTLACAGFGTFLSPAQSLLFRCARGFVKSGCKKVVVSLWVKRRGSRRGLRGFKKISVEWRLLRRA